MRIAITGASGTGKTFLAQALAEHFGIPINPVGSRSVAQAMGFDNPYDVDKAGRRVEFQERLFSEKVEWENLHDSFVTDRSYFDNLSYCALHMPAEMPDGTVERYAKAMRRYTAILFCPLQIFQQLDDGVRVTSRTYHELYEILLLGILSSDCSAPIQEAISVLTFLLQDRVQKAIWMVKAKDALRRYYT